MSEEMKDTADLFAAEGEGAREILEGLKEQAQDALGLVISEAPAEGDFLGRYRHFKERELPLIMRLEDPGERRAVLEDIAKAHELKVSDLRKALSAAEKRAEEVAAQEDHEGGGAQEEALAPEPGTERYEKALTLLRCPDMLLRVAQDMERLGHIGEPRNKRLAFVCAVSAMAGYPIQPSTHAASSAGKNYLWGTVLSLVPPEMVIERSGLSAKALFRTDMELKGKVLYIQEVAGSEDAEFTIRVLQSDGKLVYEATEKDADGSMRNVVHEKEGPTVVVQTTTRIHLHHENETRVFPIYIDESSAQTERIVQSILQEAEEGGVGAEEREEIIEVWHDAVRLLEPIRVIVPYARRIRVPSSQVRIRRDVTRLLDVVRVITWLHQHNRTRDQHGRIIATEEDFRTALALVEEPLMKSWQALSPAEERVMAAIRRLPEEERQKGFKRRNLAVEGAQPRTVQEALSSLASTGYLESDGRGGQQGHTYTLVRDPEGMTLGISLEAPDDAAGEDEGTRGSREKATAR
jgi:DNA primase